MFTIMALWFCLVCDFSFYITFFPCASPRDDLYAVLDPDLQLRGEIHTPKQFLALSQLLSACLSLGQKNWGGGHGNRGSASLLRVLKSWQWVKAHWVQANYLAMASTLCPSGLSSLNFWQYEFTYIQSQWRKTCWRFPGFPYIKLCSEFLDNFEIRNLITAFFTILEDASDWRENNYFSHNDKL